MKKITEEMGIHKDWMPRAKDIKTTEEMKKFIDELVTDYEHDYGTICHAVAAAAIAAANAVQRSPQGGITGFQAGCIMWEIIGGWGVWGDGPMQMIEWNNLLYPQYDDKMPRSITETTFRTLQEKAKELLNKNPASPTQAVRERWTMIAEGRKPSWLTERSH